MGAPKNILIVGGSAAGLSAADGLREGGYQGPITILNAEPRPGYDRPTLSKALLSGTGEPEVRELRQAAHFAEKGYDVRTGVAAARLDADRKVVTAQDGEEFPYDALLVATGTRNRTLTTDDGLVLPTMRTAEDLVAIRDQVNAADRITVVGAGFIGLEVAASLRERGKEVTLFGAHPLPMDHIIGPEVATIIRDDHRAHGVDLHSETYVTGVSGTPGDYLLRYTDRDGIEHTHATGCVIAGIGVTPNIEWLEGSGLQVDGGVVTDAAGRSNLPDVWAAGDVAYFFHPLYDEFVRVHHWTNAIEQGRVVGLNIAKGTDTPYRTVPYFWTDMFERKYHYYGRRRDGDDSLLALGTYDDEEFLVLFGRDGRFHAIVSRGCERSLRGYKKLLQRGAGWDEALAHAGLTVAATGA
ncbi:3-phenylpropionate/trans-cinnamate dioxygenase ferredoxin reductase subunit [Raineyella antarctica]|uniref:3-phenylpropionate/trans-cinnamate dioxygenase ferredoxin reductase subunit n=1 Tax=Raineyella antarctica TaxID=1577474 RepID=A0A1G6H1A3_9ACTN|nr:FAD/NAD(P)-binding oxidoreductase [Raineyella antarctica]SDB87934.1 3-phenylpropionate/trans-cinnamate dioxygenase ferredoxin reductase subunit [Raineyella antarctica]